jgi:hypothetical protein
MDGWMYLTERKCKRTVDAIGEKFYRLLSQANKKIWQKVNK